MSNLKITDDPGIKPWWQSKTIWTQIIGLIFAAGAGFQWWPKEVAQEEVVSVVMAIITVLTIVFRWGPSATVTLKSPEK